MLYVPAAPGESPPHRLPCSTSMLLAKLNDTHLGSHCPLTHPSYAASIPFLYDRARSMSFPWILYIWRHLAEWPHSNTFGNSKPTDQSDPSQFWQHTMHDWYSRDALRDHDVGMDPGLWVWQMIDQRFLKRGEWRCCCWCWVESATGEEGAHTFVNQEHCVQCS